MATLICPATKIPTSTIQSLIQPPRGSRSSKGDIVRRPRVQKRSSSESLNQIARKPSARRLSRPIPKGTTVTRTPVAMAQKPKVSIWDRTAERIAINADPLPAMAQKATAPKPLIPQVIYSMAAPPKQRMFPGLSMITPSPPPMKLSKAEESDQDTLSRSPTSISAASDMSYSLMDLGYSRAPSQTSMGSSSTSTSDDIILARSGSSESLSRCNHIYDKRRSQRGSTDNLVGDLATASSAGVSFFTDSSIARAKLEMV